MRHENVDIFDMMMSGRNNEGNEGGKHSVWEEDNLMAVIADTRESMAQREWYEILERERRVRMICAELNHFMDLKASLTIIMKHVSVLSGCNAIGIRLQDGNDYPYYVYQGFSESFIEKDISLDKHLTGKKHAPAANGINQKLDNIRGRLMRNSLDPEKWSFTPYGTYWTNLNRLRPGKNQDYLLNPVAFLSAALVPIKSPMGTLGLLYVYDVQMNRFTPGIIADLELIAGQVGLAVQNNLTYCRLRQAYRELQVMNGLIPICAECKKIRNKAGIWQSVENYISQHFDVEFTHDICPVCLKRLYPDFCQE